MKINFVLPRNINVPMGGYKIIFQYARKMSNMGNDVHIYFYRYEKNKFRDFLKYVQGVLSSKKFRNVDWFDLKNVRLHFEQTEKDIKNISEGKIIATHWSTAKVVSESNCDINSKYYFIQGYEIFDPKVTKQELEDTWKLPLKKVVVSKWLLKKGEELGIQNIKLLPNFIDTDEYPLNIIDKNKRNTVSFLWHENPKKQADIGIRIAKSLCKKYPELNFVMFGVGITEKPKGIEIVDNATLDDLNRIYRESLVYFMPSEKEGWGLTGMEAMACGAAVVAIDNGGIWEYADSSSAIIVPNNEEKLKEAIIKLLDNNKLRKSITEKAMKKVEKMTLEVETKKFLSILK
ncbi:glycosyltransferase family 4 protein [Ligilactobacillus equi]